MINQVNNPANAKVKLAFDSVIENLKDALSPASKLKKEIEQQLEWFEDKAELAERQKDGLGYIPYSYAVEEEELDSVKARLYFLLDAINKVIRKPIYSVDPTSYSAQREKNFKLFSASSESMEAHYFDGKLIIRMPVIGKKLNGYYSKMNTEDLRVLVQNQMKREEIPYSYFKKKTVNYRFIYSTHIGYVCDSDNHDTKSVTDAITMILGGDDASSCDFSYATSFRDDIPQGTYIIICRGRGCYESDEILNWFRE